MQVGERVMEACFEAGMRFFVNFPGQGLPKQNPEIQLPTAIFPGRRLAHSLHAAFPGDQDRTNLQNLL